MVCAREMVASPNDTLRQPLWPKGLDYPRFAKSRHFLSDIKDISLTMARMSNLAASKPSKPDAGSASAASAPAPLRVRMVNAYLFRGLARSVENRASDSQHLFFVMLAGSYSADWEFRDRSGRLEARAGDVVFWHARTTRTERSDPDDPMRAITITAEWDERPRGLEHVARIVNDRQGLIAATA